MSLSLREFAASGILRGDQGKPIDPNTPLIRAAIEGYESREHDTIALVSPRRQGKSTAASLLASYELLFRENAMVLFIASSLLQGSDVAGQKISKPLIHNPNLEGLNLEFSREHVRNLENGSEIRILSSSERTTPGRSATLIICDESRGIPRETWEVIRPSAASGQAKIFAIGTSSGPEGWWWELCSDPPPRTFVRQFNRADLNPEVRQSFVEAERERLSKTAWQRSLALREWEAAWIHLAEHPLCDPGDVERAMVDKVRPPGPDEPVFCGVDSSISKDKTSIVILARDVESSINRIIDCFVWDPKVHGPVSYELIEKKLELIWYRYRDQLRSIVCDRFQMLSIESRLRSKNIPIRSFAVTAAWNEESFTRTAEVLSEGRLQIPKTSWGERIRAELLNLEISETSQGGIKILDRSRALHRDLAFSCTAALAEAELCRPILREPDFCPSDETSKVYWEDPSPELTAQREAAEKLREVEEDYDESLRKLLGRDAEASSLRRV